MPLIEEALPEFTEIEKKIHDVCKDFSESDVINYAIKRLGYEQISASEMHNINDIYEQGTTTFDVDIPSLQKTHKLRILSQKEKTLVNKMADNKFNSVEGKKEYFSEDLKMNAVTEFKIVATLAYSLIEVNGDKFDVDVAARFKKQPNQLTIQDKIEYCELLPSPIISTLYNRYLEFEGRIYSIFQYESMRKK